LQFCAYICVMRLFNWNKKADTESRYSASQGKSQQELVEEVHREFNSAGSLVLQAATSTISDLKCSHAEITEKSKRLEALGFTSSKEVTRAFQLNRKLSFYEKQRTALEFFSRTYPQYKFITADAVKDICDKYGLVLGTVSDFIGEIPEKNLKEMEAFKINPEDECYALEMKTSMGRTIIDSKLITYKDFISCEKQYRGHGGYGVRWVEKVIKVSREIVAPVKYFNMERKAVKGHQIIDDDPIVLHPVCYNGEKYYLVETAWGPEASDETVVNQRMN